MKRSLFASQIERFKLWWREPPTRRDRITGALIGAIWGFWVGILWRIILGPLPAPFSVVLLWGLGAIIFFAVIGAIFPKSVSIILLPFSIWGQLMHSITAGPNIALNPDGYAAGQLGRQAYLFVSYSEMTKIEFISLATVPVTLLATAAIVFVSVALATKKSRLETVRAIQSKNFGANHFSIIGGLWALYFHFLFGDRILAKRQALTIPLYTLVVSGIFFLIWVIYLYIFRNPTHSFSANLPMSFKQAANDFYHKGIIATLLIDFTTIQLTKMAIRTGAKSGYYSIRFAVTFFTTLAIAYFIFSLAVFYFRVEDMVRLYIELAPNDPIPIMPYAPFANMASSLSLFYPQTIIHVTTQGLFSTYFMPEPLIFYCAVTAQVSLLSITLGYQIAAGLERLKNLCISLVRSVGTPQVNAYSVIFLVILGLISIPIIALSFLAIVSSK